MRCAEVKARLIKQERLLSLDSLLSEISAHIDSCDQCMNEFKAIELLTKSIEKVQTEDIQPDIPFAAMRTRLTAVKHAKPRMRFGLSTALPAVAIALSVLVLTFWPKTVQHPLEYSVAISGLERELAEDSELICDLLMNIGLSDADIKQVDCQLTCELEVVHLQSQAEVDRLVNALTQINSIELETDIKSVPLENGV